MVDIAVIGGGPAGLSAAIHGRARNKSVLVIGNPSSENPLYRAERVENYPGLPGYSGAQLLQALEDHARAAGAELRTGRVTTIMPTGGRFFLNIGSEVEEAGAVVLAIGARRGEKLPGETRLLGRGVSWCATCDGMLYRGKPVAVVGLSHDAPAEANFLQEIGCQVAYIARRPPVGLRAGVPVITGRRIEIIGRQAVEGVAVNDTLIPCAGAFILREAMAPDDLLPGLALSERYIQVDRTMATSVPGAFACGDCVGPPLQAVKAAGEGLIAGQSAADYLDQ